MFNVGANGSPSYWPAGATILSYREDRALELAHLHSRRSCLCRFYNIHLLIGFLWQGKGHLFLGLLGITRTLSVNNEHIVWGGGVLNAPEFFFSNTINLSNYGK